jgi:MFS family permease
MSPAAQRAAGVVLLGLAALGLAETFRIKDDWSGARLLPLIVTIAFFGLGLGHLLGARPAAPAAVPDTPAETPHRGRVALVLAGLAAYVALMPLLGFLAGTAALVLGMVRLLGRYSWPVSLALAAGLALAAHLVFSVWLGMPLPEGPLAP